MQDFTGGKAYSESALWGLGKCQQSALVWIMVARHEAYFEPEQSKPKSLGTTQPYKESATMLSRFVPSLPYKKGQSRGAALVEYGMLVGLIAVVATASVATLGKQVQGVFSQVSGSVETAMAVHPENSGAPTPVALATPSGVLDPSGVMNAVYDNISYTVPDPETQAIHTHAVMDSLCVREGYAVPAQAFTFGPAGDSYSGLLQYRTTTGVWEETG